MTYLLPGRTLIYLDIYRTN